MKKFAKVLAVLSVATVACAGIAAISACNTESGTSYNGEYHYSASGNEYGIKVKVTVEDGKITKVERVASNYVECTQALPDYGWTEDDVANWNDNFASLLRAYEGKTVEEVLAATGSISGQEEATTNAISDSDLCVTGATQGSVRVLKAVQDALKDVQ